MFAQLSARVAAAFNDRVRSWVHPSVGADDVLAARHSSLIASHLLGGVLSAVVFAGYFAWTGAPGAAALIACLCFTSQIAVAIALSRTGALEIAHLLSAANLTALVTLAAALSGGTQSFAIAWLILVPLEAALSADRRMMVLATFLAVAALLGLHGFTVTGLLPARITMPINEEILTLVTLLGGAAYAGALVSSVQDIHRSSARDVERSRELYRLIAENANDLITRHDATGRMTFASLASRSLLGVDSGRLAGGDMQDYLQPTDWERHKQSLTRCLAQGVPVSEEYRVERARSDGTGTDPVWLEMRCQPVAPNDAQPAGSVIAVTRDITIRKAEVLELARARDEAERASRAKTAFLATMSHELRTPLNAIIGFSEILHRELLIKSREPKQADYCRVIHQSGEHLLSLVKDLLDVSKIESGKFSVVIEPFAIDEVVPMAVDTLRPLALSKGIILHCDIEQDLPDLLADRRAIRQILINLVSNACKFTDKGGRVSVSARSVDDNIEITVSDSGIGIAPEHIQRIGQPFYQVDTRYSRQQEGAGLGLSIVRGLVELHNGRLEIESMPGYGSRFSVIIAADEPMIELPEPVKAPRLSTIVDLADVHRRQMQRVESISASAGVDDANAMVTRVV